jgi:glutathione S-transferase
MIVEPNKEMNRLALYYFPSCPYCVMVLRSIDEMGLDIELRNIFADRSWRAELIEEGGRSTVPCLRIAHDNAEVEWMYESYEIIDYLRDEYS